MRGFGYSRSWMGKLAHRVWSTDFLIFLFFLALSAIFWLLMTLNRSYEQEYKVPVRLVNVPKNAVITTNIDDTVSITLYDKGYNLLGYMAGNKLKPINIDFDKYANKATGRGLVPIADVQKAVYQQLFSSSKINAFKSGRLDFYFNYGRSKRVPVILTGNIKPGDSYYLAAKRILPEAVLVYASKQTLDSITSVQTEFVNLVNFNDTIERTVSLHSRRGVKVVPSKVKVIFYPDILTEESFDVPIVAVNMPAGKVLRTFPARVKVHFTVGASLFRRIRPEQFRVQVDYNEIAAHPSDKCTLRLRTYPHGVSKCRLEMRQVDYLIEQQ